ncbi:unnamed protein product, partial [Ectocarpus sp. 13 AM-2016]
MQTYRATTIKLSTTLVVSYGTSDKSAKSLQILLVMFAGMLAFDVLDRLTGDWTVTNSDWFQAFYVAVIQ